MNRIFKTTAALIAAAALSATGAVGAADASTTSSHSTGGASKGDIAFLRLNEQVNLAEVTLGKIVLKRSVGHNARSLARETLTDHERLAAANKRTAKRDGITLPTAPNAMQKALAKKLSTVSKVALTYFKIQVAAHKVSIAKTKHEIASGKSQNIKAYAQNTYLPVAERHLMMSEQYLKHFNSTH